MILQWSWWWSWPWCQWWRWMDETVWNSNGGDGGSNDSKDNHDDDKAWLSHGKWNYLLVAPGKTREHPFHHGTWLVPPQYTIFTDSITIFSHFFPSASPPAQLFLQSSSSRKTFRPEPGPGTPGLTGRKLVPDVHRHTWRCSIVEPAPRTWDSCRGDTCGCWWYRWSGPCNYRRQLLKVQDVDDYDEIVCKIQEGTMY